MELNASLRPSNQCFKIISHQVEEPKNTLLAIHCIYYWHVIKCTLTCNLQNDFVVETSLVGTVMNGLSHLRGCTDRGQFIINLLRGLGANLNMSSRLEFAKQVIFFIMFIKHFSI